MPEPFGKRNRPAAAKPVSKPAMARTRHAQPKSNPNPKLYLYGAAAVLFVILAAYAFAQ